MKKILLLCIISLLLVGCNSEPEEEVVILPCTGVECEFLEEAAVDLYPAIVEFGFDDFFYSGNKIYNDLRGNVDIIAYQDTMLYLFNDYDDQNVGSLMVKTINNEVVDVKYIPLFIYYPLYKEVSEDGIITLVANDYSFDETVVITMNFDGEILSRKLVFINKVEPDKSINRLVKYGDYFYSEVYNSDYEFIGENPDNWGFEHFLRCFDEEFNTVWEIPFSEYGILRKNSLKSIMVHDDYIGLAITKCSYDTGYETEIMILDNDGEFILSRDLGMKEKGYSWIDVYDVIKVSNSYNVYIQAYTNDMQYTQVVNISEENDKVDYQDDYLIYDMTRISNDLFFVSTYEVTGPLIQLMDNDLNLVSELKLEDSEYLAQIVECSDEKIVYYLGQEDYVIGLDDGEPNLIFNIINVIEKIAPSE